MRRVFLRIHRWLAIPFGVFCCVACFTGAVLTFQDELLGILNWRLHNLSGNERLEDRELAQRILDQLDPRQTIAFVRVPEERGEPAEVNIAGMGRKNLLVNPYTGEILGYPKYSGFFDGVTSFHRWLFNRPANHRDGGLSVGRVVMGATAIAMSLILISGIVLWIPKNKKALKSRLKVSTTKGFRRFVYDSHVSLGIYAAIFLLLASLTGPTWSFGWYKQAAMTITGARDDVRVDAARGGNGARSGAGAGAARGRTKETAADVRFIKGDLGRRRGGAFHPLMTSLHMGRWAGGLSKTLYLLAALVGGFLPISGYYMWWKRTRGVREGRDKGDAHGENPNRPGV